MLLNVLISTGSLVGRRVWSKCECLWVSWTSFSLQERNIFRGGKCERANASKSASELQLPMRYGRDQQTTLVFSWTKNRIPESWSISTHPSGSTESYSLHSDVSVDSLCPSEALKATVVSFTLFIVVPVNNYVRHLIIEEALIGCDSLSIFPIKYDIANGDIWTLNDRQLFWQVLMNACFRIVAYREAVRHRYFVIPVAVKMWKADGNAILVKLNMRERLPKRGIRWRDSI